MCQQGKILTCGHLRIRKIFRTERDKEIEIDKRTEENT
jgi:hypothetical protein